ERAPGQHGQKRQREAGDRRALSERTSGNRALVRERDEEVRRVGGPSARNRPDELEIGEGEDGGEDGQDGGERQQQHPGDPPEDLPVAGAVDGRPLVPLPW